jgi:hypothetical protein
MVEQKRPRHYRRYEDTHHDIQAHKPRAKVLAGNPSGERYYAGGNLRRADVARADGNGGCTGGRSPGLYLAAMNRRELSAT